MQDIIYLGEQVLVNNTIIYNVDTSDNYIVNYEFKKIDSYQNILNAYIKSPFFPWVCLILLLNEGSWHKPINLILIAHWFFRATGDLLRNLMQLNPIDFGCNWPYSSHNWLVSNAIAHIFWLTGEIIGDWYLLMRAKAVTTNKKRLRLVYYTCIVFNILKVVGMLCYFIHTPMNLKIKDENNRLVKDIVDHNIAWWSTVMLLEIASCTYFLTVVYALKSGTLSQIEKKKSFKYNPFIEKIRKVSEYRIITSIIISMFFLPFVVLFIITLLNEYMSDAKEEDYILRDHSVEQLRQVVLSFNYSFIYIDQILLRQIVIGKRNRITSYNLSHPTLVISTKSIDNDFSDIYNHNNYFINKSVTTIPDS
eukprot:jgi/Orpsp1_1/1190392/evm.model.d7180000078684.1